MFVLVEGERLDLRANVGGEDVLFVPERSILIFLLHFPGILGQLFVGKVGGPEDDVGRRVTCRPGRPARGRACENRRGGLG